MVLLGYFWISKA